VNRASRSVLLGLTALVLYTIHEIEYILHGQPENGLWTCNVGLIAVGVGLLIPSAICNAVGTFWMTAGLPLWIVYMLTATDGEMTSVLTHIGGLILGYIGIRRLGLPSPTWLIAILALAGLIVVSRPLTPAAANINFSHGVYEGTRRFFPSYWIYMSALFVAFTAVFTSLQWGLPKLGFGKP
jgi:hypothetical protein